MRLFCLGRAAVGCSVSGVGEAIIRAALAREVAAAAADAATDLDAACSAALEEGILQARLCCCRYESRSIKARLAGLHLLQLQLLTPSYMFSNAPCC